MQFDTKKQTQAQNYKLMTSVVVPRPIAWVTTISESGIVKLAPFSSFTFVSHNPPMVAIGVEDKPAGGLKDTARNVLLNGEFVVHIADQTLLAQMHASAEELPADVSEVEKLGLSTAPSVSISVPRLSSAKVAIECKLHRCYNIGLQPMRLLVGEALHLHLHDEVVSAGKVDSLILNPVCRLGGQNYAVIGEVTTMAMVGHP